MKKIIVLLVLVFCQVFVFAQDIIKSEQMQKFEKDFKGAVKVVWDTRSGAPEKITGNTIFLENENITPENVQQSTKAFLLKYKELFNIDESEIKFKELARIKDKYIVTYQQYYHQLPVWNVFVKIKVTNKGQILSIKSPCYKLNISINPNITVENAINIVCNNFNIINEDDKISGELLLFPDLDSNKVRLCWHIKEEKYGNGFMIDAMSGKNIFNYDMYRKEEVSGTVQLNTWSIPGEANGTPDITIPCENIEVKVTVNLFSHPTDITNHLGEYSIDVNNSGMYTLSSKLKGPHCWVENQLGSDAEYTSQCTTGVPLNWTWNEVLP